MDKAKKYVLALSLLVLVILSGIVHAQAENIVIKYDNKKNTVIVSGSLGEKSGLLTTISFFEYGTTLGDTNLPKLFGTAISGSKGEISCELVVPDTLSTGKYSVMVKNEEESTDDLEYIYSNVNDVKTVMELMNDANTQSEIANVIKNNPYSLMLDGTTLSDTFVNELATVFYTLRSPSDYIDYLIFQSDFEQSKAVVRLNNGEDVKRVIEEVSEYTGFNLKMLETYTKKVQELMIGYLKSIDYSKGLLKDQIPQIRTLAYFKSSDTWGKAKLNVLGIKETGETVNDNFLVLSPSLDYYSKVKNINSVYEKLFSYKESVITFADLKKYFEKAAKEVYGSENNQNIGESEGSIGGSGGGYGGGSWAGVVADIGSNQQNNNETSVGMFSDISGHWARESIEKLSERKIISGYPDGSFGPERNITRAEFTKILVTVMGYSEESYSDVEFDDVQKGSWYYNYVAYAKQKGIVNGISEKLFSPDAQMTRQDVCVAVFRCVSENFDGIDGKTEFSDEKMIADYAKEAVEKLSAVGIVNGYEDGNFLPHNKITRAEATVILTRLFDFLG